MVIFLTYISELGKKLQQHASYISIAYYNMVRWIFAAPTPRYDAFPPPVRHFLALWFVYTASIL